MTLVLSILGFLTLTIAAAITTTVVYVCYAVCKDLSR